MTGILNGILPLFKNNSEIWVVMLQKIEPLLQIMWKGMLGIFVVMSIIALIVFVFTKVIKK